MQFYDYESLFTVARPALDRRSTPDGFYQHFLDTIGQHVRVNPDNASGFNQGVAERIWYKLGRPYYNVYPKIALAMTGADLSQIKASSIRLPLETLLFRFSENNALSFADGPLQYHLRTVMASMGTDAYTRKPILTTWLDFGERFGGGPLLTYQKIPIGGDMMLLEAMESLKDSPFFSQGVQVPKSYVYRVVSIVVTSTLLSSDSIDQLITPDVLDRDRRAWDEADAARRKIIEERAWRRGKNGWDVGKYIEVNPHIRRPHMATFWTGPGRKVPVIKLRKGSVIHREIAAAVPTGNLDQDELTSKS